MEASTQDYYRRCTIHLQPGRITTSPSAAPEKRTAGHGNLQRQMVDTGPRGNNMIEKLEDALVSTFPPVSINRSMIDEPTANWDAYEDYADLVAFEGKTWQDFAPELLYKHSMLPVFAGDALWRAALPGYLWYISHERTRFNDLPFQLASQLTRKEDPDSHPRFDRRIAPFAPAQRTTIRDVLALLSTVSPLEDAMSRALVTWNTL